MTQNFSVSLFNSDSQELSPVNPQISLQLESDQPTHVTILGGGAWGNVLATLAERAGHRPKIWSRHLGGDLTKALTDAEMIVSAIAMKGVVEMANRLKTIQLPQATILVSATKGLDPETTRTPSQIWQEALPNNRIAVISGPNLSQEIERGLPAATVVASQDIETARVVQRVFACDRLRVYTNQDPLGTELGGALKNVMAIAIGVCDGLDLGTNAKAALITRALPEIIRVGTLLGGQSETFFGLSGLGDLLATCSSSLSRNYRVGYGLSQGKTLEQVLAEVQGTAEGVNTTHVLITLAQQRRIPVPVAWQVDQLLKGNITPQQAVEALMERDLKSES